MNRIFQNNSKPRFNFCRKLHNHRAGKNSRGFTLVELLVVLATLAVLAVTLIPALAAGKPNSLAFQCLNNLRQWGDAMRISVTDSNDIIARDGTDNNGQYAVDTFNRDWPGSPRDPYAWFNVVPTALGDKPFTNYLNVAGGNSQSMLPFPGGQGKIWHCPAAKAASSDVFLNSGSFGFFSYVMNIDLKLNRSINNGIIGNTAVYPNMPKFGAIRNPSAVVLFTDVAFSPSLENYTSSPSRNGTYPCLRWSSFSKRHNGGGTIVFADGHSAVFKWDYVFNTAAPSGRLEKYNLDIWWNPNRDIP